MKIGSQKYLFDSQMFEIQSRMNLFKYEIHELDQDRLSNVLVIKTLLQKSGDSIISCFGSNRTIILNTFSQFKKNPCTDYK